MAVGAGVMVGVGAGVGAGAHPAKMTIAIIMAIFFFKVPPNPFILSF